MAIRWLVALPLVAALGACTPVSAPSPAEPSTSAGATPDAVAVTVRDFTLDRADLVVKGPTVTLLVTNDGPTPHNVSVRTAEGQLVMATRDLSTGETETISAELAPGSYETFCSLGGHESLGIRGTLTVTAP